MIQDIGNNEYNNDFHNYEAKAGDKIIVCTPREVLVNYKENIIEFPKFEEITEYKEIRYLFSINEDRYFMATYVNNIPDKYRFESKEIFRVGLPETERFAGITGFQLYNWYASHHFCPRCGTPLVHSEKERMLECKECGMMNYPTIAPAVIVGLIDGDRICISKYAGRDYKKYALLAGFVEIGESAEETVKREVFEEVHLKVKNIKYFGSQPWSFSGSLLLGYFAELDGSDEIQLDEEELSEARFIKREDMTDIEDDGITITRAMMRAFKEGRV